MRLHCLTIAFVMIPGGRGCLRCWLFPSCGVSCCFSNTARLVCDVQAVAWLDANALKYELVDARPSEYLTGESVVFLKVYSDSHASLQGLVHQLEAEVLHPMQAAAAAAVATAGHHPAPTLLRPCHLLKHCRIKQASLVHPVVGRPPLFSRYLRFTGHLWNSGFIMEVCACVVWHVRLCACERGCKGVCLRVRVCVHVCQFLSVSRVSCLVSCVCAAALRRSITVRVFLTVASSFFSNLTCCSTMLSPGVWVCAFLPVNCALCRNAPWTSLAPVQILFLKMFRDQRYSSHLRVPASTCQFGVSPGRPSSLVLQISSFSAEECDAVVRMLRIATNGFVASNPAPIYRIEMTETGFPMPDPTRRSNNWPTRMVLDVTGEVFSSGFASKVRSCRRALVVKALFEAAFRTRTCHFVSLSLSVICFKR